MVRFCVLLRLLYHASFIFMLLLLRWLYEQGPCIESFVPFFCALTFFLRWQGFCFGLGWGGPCHSFLAQGCGVCPLLGSAKVRHLGISLITTLIFNKRPSPLKLDLNSPNICGIIFVPANGARPQQCLANNTSQTVWSMKHKKKLLPRGNK